MRPQLANLSDPDLLISKLHELRRGPLHEDSGRMRGGVPPGVPLLGAR